MKTLYTLVCLLIGSAASQAQYVSKTVTFDEFFLPNHNDYTIWFNGGDGYTYQMPAGPLTGYVVPPDSNPAGSGYPIYCYKYFGPGETCATSIDFLYDTAAVSMTGSERAVSIRLTPSADPTHFLAASVTHDKHLEITSLNWNNGAGPALVLHHNRRYRLKLEAEFISGFAGWLFQTFAAVYDVTDGTPLIVASDNGGDNDDVLPPDTAISVGFTGAKNGDAAQLDNFMFYGVLSSVQCSPDTAANATHQPVSKPVLFSIDGNTLTVRSGVQTQLQLSDVTGRVRWIKSIDPPLARFDVSELANGLYFLTLRDDDGQRSARCVLTR